MDQLKPAIFLDRDGVLNVDHGYVHQPEHLEIPAGVSEGLAKLQEAGYLLLVITNQSGVARGMFSLDDVSAFNQALYRRLKAASGVKLDKFYVCPHHPDGSVGEYSTSCECRKPNTGLIKQAANEFTIDFNKSFVIGDKPSDIALASNMNIPGIQIDLGKYGTSEQALGVVSNFEEACRLILGS